MSVVDDCEKFFNILVMVRLAAVLAIEARMAGRATLVPMEVAILEATTRAEAILTDGMCDGRGEVDATTNAKWDDGDGKSMGRELCPKGRKELCGLLVCVWERKREGRNLRNWSLAQSGTGKTMI